MFVKAYINMSYIKSLDLSYLGLQHNFLIMPILYHKVSKVNLRYQLSSLVSIKLWLASLRGFQTIIYCLIVLYILTLSFLKLSAYISIPYATLLWFNQV